MLNRRLVYERKEAGRQAANVGDEEVYQAECRWSTSFKLMIGSRNLE